MTSRTRAKLEPEQLRDLPRSEARPVGHLGPAVDQAPAPGQLRGVGSAPVDLVDRLDGVEAAAVETNDDLASVVAIEEILAPHRPVDEDG